MKKMGIFVIFSFIFLVSSVLGFDLKATPDKYLVSQGETAHYTLTLTNAQDGIYLISTSAQNSNWMTLPPRVDVYNGEAQFKVLITAPRNARPDAFGFHIKVQSYSDTSSVVIETVYMTVKSKDGIKIQQIAPSASNYRSEEPVTINIDLKSDEPLPRDVDIIFDIKNPDGTLLKTTKINTKVPADIVASYKQVFDFDQLPAGKYPVVVTVKRENYIYDSMEGNFEISPLVDLVKSKKSSWTFLAIENVIRIQNVGNSRASNVEVKDTVPLFWSYFVKDNSASLSSKGSDASYTWRLASVDPTEAKEIRYQIVLWPIYLIILALLGLGFKGYTTFLTPSITKSFTSKVNLGEGKEGSVVIHAKNKGLRTLRNVTIDDIIPPSFKILDASVPRPKYRKNSRGYELKWNLGTLAPGEERVFNYRIKNMLGIIGTVQLPRAEMKADGDKVYKSKALKAIGDPHKKPL